jgi:hypothetical protein
MWGIEMWRKVVVGGGLWCLEEERRTKRRNLKWVGFLWAAFSVLACVKN